MALNTELMTALGLIDDEGTPNIGLVFEDPKTGTEFTLDHFEQDSHDGDEIVVFKSAFQGEEKITRIKFLED